MTEPDMVAAVAAYRKDSFAHPFFVSAESAHAYRESRSAIAARGGREMRLSAFCRENDAEPDFDALLTEMGGRTDFVVLVGLGEYLALAGAAKTKDVLARLKDAALRPGAKVVVLLRGCRDALEELRQDPRFADRQAFIPTGWSGRDDFSAMLVAPGLGIGGLKWLKDALRAMEDGQEAVHIETDLAFPNATARVTRITRAYEALEREWGLPEECGTDEDWKGLLRNAPESEGFRHFLKIRRDGSPNAWLRHVAGRTLRFADFSRALVFGLLDVNHRDPAFEDLYSGRKALLADRSQAEMADYAAQTKIKGGDRIHYLTDNTETERKGIIECLSGLDAIPLEEVARRYPALAEYLRDFDFGNDGLTDYFRRYKRQKVTNRMESGFLDIVARNARTREYNHLPARDGVIDLLDKKQATLFFVDALGAEFLGFIQSRCASLGLRMKVTAARANLPSLTGYNRQFVDDWPQGAKREIRGLDDVKHGGAHGFDLQRAAHPVHLARELEIIAEVLEHVKVELASHAARRVVIAGDHGASRLVVVNGQEALYEAELKGSHWGRCCETCDAEGLDAAVTENGWMSLADYGRFRGGRAAAVEVHGGATYEEVIVPVIELRLMETKIQITPVESVIIKSLRGPAMLTLFSPDELCGVVVAVDGQQYAAERADANHWRVALPGVRRAGVYAAEAFEGPDLIGSFNVTVKSGAATENDLL